MAERKYWRDNLETVAHKSLHYATSVPAAIEALDELGDVALYNDEAQDGVYSTQTIIDALREMQEVLPDDPEDDNLRVEDTRVWDDFRNYFTSEEEIRQTVGRLHVTRQDDVIVTSKSGH